MVPAYFYWSLKRQGKGISERQHNTPWATRDYSYIELYRKAFEYENNPDAKKILYYQLLDAESKRDYHTGSMRQINNLIQMDSTPNLELKEVRSEIYKISMSFVPSGASL